MSVDTYWLFIIAGCSMVNTVYMVFMYYVILKCLKTMEKKSHD